MINQQHSTQLKKMYSNYSRIHDELATLETEVQILLNRQKALSQELGDTRKAEKELINKIEAELDREITQDDLLQIIQTHE